MTDSSIPIGRFGRAHGTRGEVRLWAYNSDSPLYDGPIEGFIEDVEGRRPVTVSSVRWAERFAIATVSGVRHRDQAEELRNLELFVDRDQLPAPDEDELYLVDTIGWPVLIEREVGAEPTPIGQVDEYLETGANDVMRVALDGGGTLLAPIIDAALVELSPELERVVLAPLDDWAPEGTAARIFGEDGEDGEVDDD